MRIDIDSTGPRATSATGPRSLASADQSWTAVVLAGTRPEGDRLAAAFGVAIKALLPLRGEPMIAHVVRTLLAAPSIARVVVLAQEPDVLHGALDSAPALTFATSGAGIAESLIRIAGTAAAPWPVLVTTADHPLLTTEMVEHLIAGSGNADIAIGVVERDVLTARYPETRRTWLRFRGGAFTGANLFIARTAKVVAGLEALASAEADRKGQWKLLWRFGPWLALGAALRLLSLDGAVSRGGRRLGLSARPVRLPFAEAGIDVDKADDLHLVERIMSGRPAP